MAAVLSAPDYIVIVLMFGASVVIGLFFAVRFGRRQSGNDYFLGSQSMSVIPVSLSLAATVMSAITYLGTPAEVYMHGPMLGLGLLSRIHVPPIVAFFFVPVFYRLRVTTIYEYLGLRFNNTVRYAVALVKSAHEFMYMGIIIYTPALALSLAAGISLPFSILSIGIICTLYTSLGGIRAVIWTDVFQASSMLIGAVIIIIAGTIRIGGAAEGWRRAVEGGRGDLFDFRIDPTIRFTFWSTVVAGTPVWIGIGACAQSQIQRYNSCKTERDAKIASWLGMIGMALIEALAIATGMTAFAYFYKCDPLTLGKISRSDQIVPFLILDLFHAFPGVPGLLIGGAFCASLSSMSSVLNGLVAAAGQDIVRVAWPKMSDFRYALIVKIISFIFGLMAVGLAFLASALGNIFQTISSIGGITGGPVLGVFILGMFFPRANSEGALVGLVGGVVLGLVQYVGSQMYPSFRDPPPLSVDGCMPGINMSYAVPTSIAYTREIDLITAFQTSSPDISTISDSDENPLFFSMSYLYLSALSTTTCIVVGLAVSYIVSLKVSRVVSPKLLSPVVACFCEKDNVSNDNGFQLNESMPLA